MTIKPATRREPVWEGTLVCLLAVLSLTLGGACKPEPPPKLPEVTMAMGMLPLASLAILADHEGLFSQAGLAVRVKKCPTGVVAMDALLRDEVQMAVAGDTPVVFGSFQRQDFRVVTGIASWDNDVRVVARKSSGIVRPEDLKGKRIATDRTSVVHFFLHMFLLRHGLSEKEMVVVYMPQAEFPRALARGEADAASVREPFVSQAKELLGTDAVEFEEPGLYVEYYNLVASGQLLREQPETARRIVRALIAAEALAKEQPERAMRIVAQAVSVPVPTLRRVWPRLDLRVRLSQSLLVTLEDQARWAVSDHLAGGAPMPNCLHFIHLETMLVEKPESVNIIR
jgi:ABC-type nitrate/sulfonate/bicarbonate transport system substrate-binding protein